MTAAQVAKSPIMDALIAAQQQIVQGILPPASRLRQGVLVPLKTTLELRDDHRLTKIIITRTPVKAANAVIT